MAEKEYIDFNEIKKYASVDNEELFLVYLREVYKDLADRQEQSKKAKGISKIIFLDYLKLPMFISEKLFVVFDENKDGYLSTKEFVLGMNKLYNGDYEETIKLIFDILDFNHDNYIEKDDVKMILSLLPLKTDRTRTEYKYQIKSLEEINDIINSTFGKNKKLDFEEFKKAITQKSDIFLQILCFLYQKKPFSNNNINVLKTSKKTLPAEFILATPQTKLKTACDNILLPSPLKNSALSPAFTLLHSSADSFNLDNEESTPVFSGFSGMVRYNNVNIPKNDGNENDVNNILKNADSIFNSPSQFLQHQNNNNNKDVKPFCLNSNDNKTKIDNNNDKVTYENWIYKISEKNRLKKYYLVLINKDIFYYKTEEKKEVLGMHNLSGCFLKESGNKMINNKKYYCFSIISPTKERNYYVDSEQIYEEFTKKIKQSFNYLNFFDYYEMLDDLGEGIFGSVKLGAEKKTKERVAIKIIKKNKAKPSDIELVRTEIDVMKLCHHPNVVHLLDHFENADHIFIVMEYIKGGRLSDYMKEKRYKFTEKRVAEIIYQICLGVKYLHKYGIVHRDLKPDNIMLTESGDKGNVKIMDFGLSKIMGKKEKAVEGFGTLTFVAPEVLVRKPYNKEVDIWSIGVIMYLMMSGLLPFDDANDDEQKIANSIVFEDVKFPNEQFQNVSKEAIELMKGCMTKDPRSRIKIDEIIKSSWIQKLLF